MSVLTTISWHWDGINSWNCGALTHWGRVTHICVGKLTIIGSDNGLLPERRPAIISTNAGILLVGPLGTNFSEILIEIQAFSLKKIRLKMSSAKCCSFHLGLNVLKTKAHVTYLVSACRCWWLGDATMVILWEYSSLSTWALIQYKDVILPVWEIPLWR